MGQGKRASIATSATYLDSYLKKLLEHKGFSCDMSSDGDTLFKTVAPGETKVAIIQAGVSSGNGLNICREFCDSENTRKIPVVFLSASPQDEQSALDAGARVFLKVPFDESVFLETINRVSTRGKRILIVDDSKVIHLRTGEFLEKNGFEVLHAYNGAEGLEMTRNELPDAIISDIEMPVMDGYTMCRNIKTCDATALIPVIMVSSLDQGINIDKGFDAGANDYLIKPVVNNELLSCINTLVHTMEVRRKETVLIVDDSVTILNMLKFGLLRQGFNVISCIDGEEAYSKILEHHPDIVIADLAMPKLDGYQLVKYLKENRETANTPVIITSSRESRSSAAKGLRIGASTFISKPYTMDKILINVERLTAEQRLQRERDAMRLYISEAAMEAAKRNIDSRDEFAKFHASEKQLTILFSDIVGFTSICEKFNPMDTVQLLNTYLDLMTNILKSHGAIIDKFIGDAILAFFGTDSSGMTSQHRAVKAGLEMIASQKEFNKTSKTLVQTRVGVDFGKVIFADIGSKYYRRDYTIIGDHVNTAQRLQTMASPDTVYMSDPVFQIVRKNVKTENMGLLDLKGKDIKIQAYRAIEYLNQ